MTELKHTFKTDILFKLLFSKNPNLLKRLTSHFLQIPYESITHFQVENPEMSPDVLGNKFCRLDIHMTVNGQSVTLEVQVENRSNYPERTLFYWARTYSSKLPAGDDYSMLPRTIVISILRDTLFKQSTEFHSEFQALEVTRNQPLTDKLVLKFYELSKLPTDTNKDNRLLQWLRLFKANTVEELKEIDDLEVPELSEAINAYHTVTASEEFKEIERLRLKASHDEAQAISDAEKRGSEQERQKWQNVVTDKDAQIEKLKEQLANLNKN